jgi:uncharacterized protein
LNIYFADTSALAKRYVPEPGAAWVRGWIDPSAGNMTIISAMTTVEFVSLLARRQREGNVSPADFARLRNDFLIHVQQQYSTIQVNHLVLAYGRQLIAKHPLRTLDAIQLASAILAQRTIQAKPIFVSADVKLLAIASLEGFVTDNPNAHP